MQCLSLRAFALAARFILAAFVLHAPFAIAQSGPGWISLFDGKTIGSEWDYIGQTN